MTENIINPFGTSEIKDYEKLFKEFGVSRFNEILPKLPDPLVTMKRGIIFGHRDLKPVIEAINNKKKFAVMSGIKPSNYLHIGSKMVVDEIVYFQNHGGLVYYAIADLETLVDNGLSFEESRKYAYDNLLDLIALGIDPRKAKIYLQSEEIKVQRLAYVYSRNVTSNTLKAIYGEQPIGMYMAALTQVGDILLPQVENGPIPVVVPVGFDQDPHIRLTRDIAVKHGLIPPASTYHKFISSLLGVEKKMSKREPNGIIYLNEDPAGVKKKIMKYAFSGGQATAEEQRRLGANIDVDVPYHYLTNFEENDKELERIKEEYSKGRMLSGEIKTILADKIEAFLIKHQDKREKAKSQVDKILSK